MGKPANKPPRRKMILVELDSVILKAPAWSRKLTARVLEAFVDHGYEVVGFTDRQPSQDSFVRQHLLELGIPLSAVLMRGTLDRREYLEIKQEVVEMYGQGLAVLVDNDLEFCRSVLHRGFSTLQTLGAEGGVDG